MERRGITNPYVCSPGLVMFYPGFTQNQQTQPVPRRTKENIQPRLEEMWNANQSISTPQNYGRNYVLPPQMSTSLLGIDPTSQNAYNAMQYAIIEGHNPANQVPNYTLSNLQRLEMFPMSKAIGGISSSIPVEKSTAGCRGINVPSNNHEVWKIRSNNDPALDRKSTAMKEETPYEINDIRDIRNCKRTILHLVTQEDSSQDLMENPSIKRTCTTELHENSCDCRPIKTDEDEDYIDVETVDADVKKEETVDDPDEASYIDVVGFGDDEKNQLLERKCEVSREEFC